jgi:hypothetical protein
LIPRRLACGTPNSAHFGVRVEIEDVRCTHHRSRDSSLRLTELARWLISVSPSKERLAEGRRKERPASSRKMPRREKLMFDDRQYPFEFARDRATKYASILRAEG